MNNAHLRSVLACLGLTVAVVCSGAPRSSAENDFESLEKIDVHVHINSPDTALLDQAAADHFRLLTINVDYPDFPALADQSRIAKALVAAHPERVAYSAAFSMRGWDDPQWQQHVIQQLDDAFKSGAVAVKVWKNIGMEFRDAKGRLVMIDDPKFDPVFAYIREQHKVLIGHQGEPYNCWLPISKMTVNGDKEYFKEHPQYHMFLHPEMPSWADQMAARDRMLDAHPKLHFVGMHMASLERNVDELAAFLDRYPNAVVDIAARIGQIQDQSQRDREKVRRFFIRYQDRLLYGTDEAQEPTESGADMARATEKAWREQWRYFASDQTFKVDDLDKPVQGLALPRGVIDKLYRLNAERAFPGAWGSAR